MGICSSIARYVYNIQYPKETDYCLSLFYKDIKSPFDLRRKISDYGFKWKGELSWLDWNKTPYESLANPSKLINCGDFMELYVHLYKLLGLKYEKFILGKNHPWSYFYKWHYVSTFEWQSQIWLQSNNDVRLLYDGTTIMGIYKDSFDSIHEAE